MKTEEPTSGAINIQYVKIGKQGNQIELLVNGDINNEYYEGTMRVNSTVMEDDKKLMPIINAFLSEIKEKAEKIRRNRI